MAIAGAFTFVPLLPTLSAAIIRTATPLWDALQIAPITCGSVIESI